MMVWVGQIYSEAGASFPFSHHMQGWIKDELSALATPGVKFSTKYGDGFRLGINLSARKHGVENQIFGPSVFRKTKDVEYSLFLPFDAIMKAPDSRRAAVEFMLDGIQAVFQKAGIQAERLPERRQAMIEHLCSEPTMLRAPWPTAPGVDPSSLH